MSAPDRIAALTLDAGEDAPPPSPEVEQERNIAIFDLLEANVFRLLPTKDAARPAGPYTVTLRLRERRLVFDIAGADGAAADISLSSGAFRRLSREYFEVCESYFQAVRSRGPDEIETLDKGRKALHDDGAEIIREKLAARVEIDENTARRLFTLVASLYFRG